MLSTAITLGSVVRSEQVLRGRRGAYNPKRLQREIYYCEHDCQNMMNSKWVRKRSSNTNAGCMRPTNRFKSDCNCGLITED